MFGKFHLSSVSYPHRKAFGKISAQPHITLCIQFLDRENNDKNNTLPLGKQICFTIVWVCAEILPSVFTKSVFLRVVNMMNKGVEFPKKIW